MDVIKIQTLKSGPLKYNTKYIRTNKNSINQRNSPYNVKREVDIKARENETTSSNDGKLSEKLSKVESGANQAAIGAGGAPVEVQKIFEKPDELVDAKCILVHDENSPQIYFKIPDVHNINKCSVLQCADISAADLKVSSKFDSWDTMFARILIECDGRILLWSKTSDMNPMDETQESNPLETKAMYEYKVLNSSMVKATFAIEDVAMARDMLHRVKVAKMKQISKVKELKKQGLLGSSIKNPSKIREGLPEWVNYIPYRWYSAKSRRFIQYLLMIYTLLSLLWAIWQLYRHVDFIRAYLQPIVKFIEIYFSILKAWFKWIDDLFTVISKYWWNYFKPLFMLIVAALSPLLQIFKPLKGIVNFIPFLFDPFVKFFNMLLLFIRPLFLPLKVSFNFIFEHIFKFLTHAAQTPALAYLIHRCRDLYIVHLVQEAMHGHLDPLKAQVIVIRDLIFKSTSKIYYGIRFIITRFYFMIIFVKREREYSKEGKISVHQLQSTEDEKHSSKKIKED